jgi:S-adenosyl methyltransferase
MIRKHEPRVPEGVDVTRPSIARIYDYLLFGKDNFAADRAAADKLMQSRLEPRRLALANRAFLRRAVRFLGRQGISQFLDRGTRGRDRSEAGRHFSHGQSRPTTQIP